jgi:hypothetical protein
MERNTPSSISSNRGITAYAHAPELYYDKYKGKWTPHPHMYQQQPGVSGRIRHKEISTSLAWSQLRIHICTNQICTYQSAFWTYYAAWASDRTVNILFTLKKNHPLKGQ